jgi:hypothetical protein
MNTGHLIMVFMATLVFLSAIYVSKNEKKAH